jgi:poly-gamma-glutamate synthesis protein (capsule biosynthesis protein)
MPTILIGADICPIEGNRPYFENGDAKTLFGNLLLEFEKADFVVANLECPLIENPAPIQKTGPTFGENNACINGIRNGGIDLLCLANNHIMDHGPAGLENTMKVCAAAGIATVGAGRTLADARRIFIRQIGSVRIGILAVAEHEFSIATKDSAGASPLDLIDYVRNVNDHGGAYEYLIVLLHGGDEFHVPSPGLQNTCRFMIEMGADAVIVQHPHVLGGHEYYRGGHIVYGQGALLMDEAIYRDRKSFHEGFLVKLNIAADASSSMELIPFRQSDPAPGARRMTNEQEIEFRRSLEEKSKALQDETHIRDRWRRFCAENKHDYLSGLLAHNRALRKFNARGMIEKLLYSKRALLGTRNLVCCETHREALETIFNEKLP